MYPKPIPTKTCICIPICFVQNLVSVLYCVYSEFSDSVKCFPAILSLSAKKSLNNFFKQFVLNLDIYYIFHKLIQTKTCVFILFFFVQNIVYEMSVLY